MDILAIHRGLMPAALIAEAVDTLCEMLCPQGPGEADLDTLVDRLRAEDRARLGAVYDAFRETLIFQRIIAAPALVEAGRIQLRPVGRCRLS